MDRYSLDGYRPRSRTHRRSCHLAQTCEHLTETVQTCFQVLNDLLGKLIRFCPDSDRIAYMAARRMWADFVAEVG